MRHLLLLSLIISCMTAGWMLATQVPMSIAGKLKVFWQEPNVFLSPRDNANEGVERLTAVEAYEDLDYGFKVAIPVGWRRIVTADSIDEPVDSLNLATESRPASVSAGEPLLLEPGYAVGFESVQQSENDRFADYILIEVLPGEESGRFDADNSLRQPVTIDGRDTWFDRLEIDQVSSGLIDVDLVVYQAELSGVGYTVGLYAIGEPIREQLLAMAFEVMLQTFKIVRDPFTIS